MLLRSRRPSKITFFPDSSSNSRLLSYFVKCFRRTGWRFVGRAQCSTSGTAVQSMGVLAVYPALPKSPFYRQRCPWPAEVAVDVVWCLALIAQADHSTINIHAWRRFINTGHMFAIKVTPLDIYELPKNTMFEVEVRVVNHFPTGTSSCRHSLVSSMFCSRQALSPLKDAITCIEPK